MAGSSEGGNWSLIESDPAVFSELIREFGASGVEVEELWALGAEAFSRLEPLHGLIFLFRWGAEVEPETPAAPAASTTTDHVFFARQVTQNACATQAVVNLLLNVRHPDLQLGTALQELRDFCAAFDPHMKGLALANSPLIRAAHNSFARQTLYECDARPASKDDEAFHFVSYLPIDGRLYELDGLKEAPVDLGVAPPNGTWVDVFREHIKNRIDRYSEGEIRFNLMALVSDRKMIYERQMAEIAEQIEKGGMETDDKKDEMAQLQILIEAEVAKQKRNRAENARRKHNYLAFIVELLKILAKEGKLMPLYEKAKEKAMQKVVRKLDV